MDEYSEYIRNPKKLEAQLNKLRFFDPQRLTTPKEIDDVVTEFCNRIVPGSAPVYLTIKPQPWSRQSCCDLNVKKYIEENGGKFCCGYKIWYNKPSYIESERHCVWSSGSELIDITFNADGEERILFLPDVPERQDSLSQNARKHRYCTVKKWRPLIRAFSAMESMANIQNMSSEESWKTMLSYEDWKSGKRMNSIVLKGEFDTGAPK